MRVVIPAQNLHPATAEYAERVRADVVPVGEDDLAYWRLVRSLWAAGEGWLNVEHDIGPTLDQTWRLLGCPNDWCALPYRYRPDSLEQTISLGCMKFGPALIARHPTWIADIPENQRHWGGLDGFLWNLGLGAHYGAPITGKERVHVHPGEVTHYQRETVVPLYRRTVLANLEYLGNGSQYLHEDASLGIPPIPAANFETDDERVIALCLESGLYRVAKAKADDAPTDAPASGDDKAAKKGNAAEAADAATK